jgi:hypothetical protein
VRAVPSHRLSIATFREQVPVTDPTDPNALVRQPYSQPVPTGGFLHVRVEPAVPGVPASILFTFYDQWGRILHATRRYHGDPQ